MSSYLYLLKDIMNSDKNPVMMENSPPAYESISSSLPTFLYTIICFLFKEM